jgi:hypothetical protein
MVNIIIFKFKILNIKKKFKQSLLGMIHNIALFPTNEKNQNFYGAAVGVSTDYTVDYFHGCHRFQSRFFFSFKVCF